MKPVRYLSYTFLTVLLLLILIFLSGCGKKKQNANLKPRYIILISLDTLRAERMGLYGYERNTDPFMNLFGDETVVFWNVSCQNTQTLISHKSFLSAKYPLRLLNEITGASLDNLIKEPQDSQFLADAFTEADCSNMLNPLSSAGYKTAAITDAGWVRKAFGFDKGFEYFDDEGGRFKKIVPRFKEWIKGNKETPFFLFLHSYDVHCPYWCREPYNSRYCKNHNDHIDLRDACGKPTLMEAELTERDVIAIRDHYDGGIASADSYIRDIFDFLKEQGIYDEAMIIVTSDHGESLKEHGQVGHGGFYPEQLGIPLIIKFPADSKIEPARFETPAALLDVMPTILDTAGIAIPEGIDGKSLLPVIRKGGSNREYLISQISYKEGINYVSNPTKRAVLQPEKWLLIHDALNEAVELYDLKTDPTAMVNIADDNVKMVRRLLLEIIRCDPAGQDGEFRKPDSSEMDEEVIKNLKSLGYLN